MRNMSNGWVSVSPSDSVLNSLSFNLREFGSEVMNACTDWQAGREDFILFFFITFAVYTSKRD